MGLIVSRSVEIQISNKTKNITLRNPRTYFFSGYSLKSPEPSVPPGSSTTCKFINNSLFLGCNGLLLFEAESFTLAIYFSNPFDHNRFYPETGLELSQDKIHKGNLSETYNRLAGISLIWIFKKKLTLPSVILKESQETAQLNAGPVKLTATMSQGWDTVIKVKVEEQGSPDREPEARQRARVKHSISRGDSLQQDLVDSPGTSHSEETEVSCSEEEIQLSCSVEIQISNETKNIVLKDLGTFLVSGHCLKSPEPSVPPGTSTTCKFKSTESENCRGLLLFEAETFTLTIYFFNPIDHNRFYPKMALELSLDKIHKGDLEKTYDLARISHGSDSKEDLTLFSVTLKESQETAQLNAGPVKLTATMSQGRDTVIRVKMEDERSPDRELKAMA